MLRMRKRPPADLPMINSDKPWSAMDMEDLFDFYESGTPVADIADYLCRTVEEVQAKIDEVERQIAAGPPIARCCDHKASSSPASPRWAKPPLGLGWGAEPSSGNQNLNPQTPHLLPPRSNLRAPQAPHRTAATGHGAC